MRSQRKKLKKLLREMGVMYEETTLHDGRVSVEVSGATFFFEGPKCVTATTTATAKRWAKKAPPNGVEHA